MNDNIEKVKPLVKIASSYPVTIYMAGSYIKALKVLEKYCDTVGFCVTIKQTVYVYKNGKEVGIEVGLINYPRFPAEPITIIDRATEIANMLREALEQESFSIQTPNNTIWHSYRKEDINEA